MSCTFASLTPYYPRLRIIRPTAGSTDDRPEFSIGRKPPASVGDATSSRPAMKTASAPARNQSNVARMIGDLRHGVVGCRNGRCGRDADQAHSCCHNYGEHDITHVNFSCFVMLVSAVDFTRVVYIIGRHLRHAHASQAVTLSAGLIHWNAVYVVWPGILRVYREAAADVHHW